MTRSINILDRPLGETLRPILEAGLDITGDELVDVSWSHDRSVLWVNVNGVCALRVCRIRNLVIGEEGKDGQ